MGLLIAEVYVTSYGVLGVGGIVALVLGSLLFVDTSKTNIAVRHSLIYGAAGALAVVIIGLGIFVARERSRVPTTGREGLLGEIGEIRDAVGPGRAGKVFVHGELWRATAREALAPGTRARIVAINGLEVTVEKAG